MVPVSRDKDTRTLHEVGARARVFFLNQSKFSWFILKCDWITDVDRPMNWYCACYFRSARRSTAPAAWNAASALRAFPGAERAARSVINKGGARLRARAPSRALRALGSLTRVRRPPPTPTTTTLPKTTIVGSDITLLASQSRRL